MKEICLLLVLVGFLALVPTWHQFQSTGARAPTFMPENLESAPPSVTAGMKQVDAQPFSNGTDLKARAEPAKRTLHAVKSSKRSSTGQPTDAQKRETIKSFQMTSQLQTARLDPEVANELDYQATDSLLDR
jgi:hypothetical protein